MLNHKLTVKLSVIELKKFVIFSDEGQRDNQGPYFNKVPISDLVNRHLERPIFETFFIKEMLRLLLEAISHSVEWLPSWSISCRVVPGPSGAIFAALALVEQLPHFLCFLSIHGNSQWHKTSQLNHFSVWNARKEMVDWLRDDYKQENDNGG